MRSPRTLAVLSAILLAACANAPSTSTSPFAGAVAVEVSWLREGDRGLPTVVRIDDPAALAAVAECFAVAQPVPNNLGVCQRELRFWFADGTVRRVAATSHGFESVGEPTWSGGMPAWAWQRLLALRAPDRVSAPPSPPEDTATRLLREPVVGPVQEIGAEPSPPGSAKR